MKVLVIDDHPLILDALTQLLPQLASGVVVRAAAHAGEAIAILDDEPDVALVLLDLALPGTRGLDLLADFLLDYPGVPSSCCRPRTTTRPSTRRSARAHAVSSPRPRAARRCSKRCGRCSRRCVCRAADDAAAAGTDGDAHRRDRAGPDGAPGRRAAAARAGQAQQAHLPRPPPVRGHRQGPRQRDPEGAQCRVAHAGGGRTRAAGHPRRPPPARPADRCAAGTPPDGAVPSLLVRAVADEVATLFTSWRQHDAVDAAGGAHLLRRAGRPGAGCQPGRLDCGDPRQPGVARRARARLPAGATGAGAGTRAGDGAGHWARSSRVRCGA